MCMQCVRADRREAEGRPAPWQRRQARVTFVDFRLDTSALRSALRDVGLVAKQAGIAMREAEDRLVEEWPTVPPPAQLARAADMSPYIVPGSLRIGRGA